MPFLSRTIPLDAEGGIACGYWQPILLG